MHPPFSNELLDEIGKCYARAAVDAFLADEAKKTAGTYTEIDHGHSTSR